MAYSEFHCRRGQHQQQQQFRPSLQAGRNSHKHNSYSSTGHLFSHTGRLFLAEFSCFSKNDQGRSRNLLLLFSDSLIFLAAGIMGKPDFVGGPRYKIPSRMLLSKGNFRGCFGPLVMPINYKRTKWGSLNSRKYKGITISIFYLIVPGGGHYYIPTQ